MLDAPASPRTCKCLQCQRVCAHPRSRAPHTEAGVLRAPHELRELVDRDEQDAARVDIVPRVGLVAVGGTRVQGTVGDDFQGSDGEQPARSVDDLTGVELLRNGLVKSLRPH